MRRARTEKRRERGGVVRLAFSGGSSPCIASLFSLCVSRAQPAVLRTESERERADSPSPPHRTTLASSPSLSLSHPPADPRPTMPPRQRSVYAVPDSEDPLRPPFTTSRAEAQFAKQYANLYWLRLVVQRKRVLERARKRWVEGSGLEGASLAPFSPPPPSGRWATASRRASGVESAAAADGSGGSAAVHRAAAQVGIGAGGAAVAASACARVGHSARGDGGLRTRCSRSLQSRPVAQCSQS